MRNEYYDDYEQAEAVKKWLKENGFAIFTGIALGLGALFGWRFWQSYQTNQKLEAAHSYEQLRNDLEGGREATAAILEAYRKEHGNTVFVGLAALELAHKAIEERNLDEAMKLLQQAADSADPVELRHVAGLRLARVQAQAGLLDAALASVDRFDDGTFESLAAEIRGDILLARGDRQGAREAYEYALENLSSTERGSLQMKLDDLAPLEALAAQSSTGVDAGTPPELETRPEETGDVEVVEPAGADIAEPVEPAVAESDSQAPGSGS